MGTSASKNSGSCHGGREGQLYVSLKMENFKIRRDLIPHVYGSVPITGSWDFAKALSMARESASMWELSFVVSPDHGMREPPARLLDPIASGDHVFLLRFNAPCVVEEGPSRLLTGGTLEEGDARSALFKIGGDEEVLEYKVFIKADIVSPFDLAASWRAYQENLEPSRVRGIPDVSINVAPNTGAEAFIATVTGYPYLNPLSSLLLTIPLHLTMPSVVLAARRAPAAEGCRPCPPYLC
ncbi:hypothetical protein GW17_00021310 [Ensete ventricosum]|nr:hypothetical protein GW17_00021310 [Ensete ventricosum]RZR92712.1 hypothetical protein BHM03_00021066 [Ensete ventricosum]